jgi:hypothetical protein
LAYKHKTNFKLDVREFGHYDLRQYSLYHFEIQEEFASKMEIENLLGYYKCKAVKLMKLLKLDFVSQSIQLDNMAEEKNLFLDESFWVIPKDSYLKGYWQSEKYFDHIKDIIRQEFSFKDPQDKVNSQVAGLIKDREAVSIHFRRTDYVKNTTTNAYHWLTDKTWIINP